LSSNSMSSRFLRMGPPRQTTTRLFCFPFAGGSAAVFAGWGDAVGPDMEVWAAQPRGRGSRFRETLHRSVSEMVEDYLVVLREQLDLPFAFYGHSLGGLLAFEATRRLCAEGLPLPEHLFIGASAPPVLGLLHPRIHDLPDEPFVAAVQERYSGIPEAVLSEPELMELFLPALKADFAAHETFDRSRVTRVPSPITAIAGSDDPVIQPAMMEEWARHTNGDFALYEVPGDHFFLATSRSLVLARIRTVMQSKSLSFGRSLPQPSPC
jgi:medium-chain acyl-[acyl-carrier-protein] hydrolase